MLTDCIRPVGIAEVIGLLQRAALTQKPRPQLDTNDAENEEDEEAKNDDIAEHRKRIQEQDYEDAQTWKKNHKLLVLFANHLCDKKRSAMCALRYRRENEF